MKLNDHADALAIIGIVILCVIIAGLFLLEYTTQSELPNESYYVNSTILRNTTINVCSDCYLIFKHNATFCSNYQTCVNEAIYNQLTNDLFIIAVSNYTFEQRVYITNNYLNQTGICIQGLGRCE